VFEAAANVVGATLNAADAIMSGTARHAFVPIAGLHHAGRDKAAGFCVFNDCGVAVEMLPDTSSALSSPSVANIQQIDAPGFPVDVYNILGAGDAFASGFLYGFVQGWGWRKAARLGNACGAIVVTRHGCANFMPTYDEVTAFVAPYGGF
jgi:sugar/nucleoside kinase (ribokinase family)